MSRQMESATGMVRIAFAKPPAPTVSCSERAVAHRDPLVADARVQGADAKLREDEARAVEGLFALHRRMNGEWIPELRHHSLR